MPDLAEYWKARAESAEVEKVTAIQDFARHTAKQIRAELVCCDVYERNHGTNRGSDGHGICFWGEASARRDFDGDGGDLDMDTIAVYMHALGFEMRLGVAEPPRRRDRRMALRLTSPARKRR